MPRGVVPNQLLVIPGVISELAAEPRRKLRHRRRSTSSGPGIPPPGRRWGAPGPGRTAAAALARA
eukprot:746451-Hanusia_phi.AAC.1